MSSSVIRGFKAVMLAGGSGERFWPLSTPSRPKQFLGIFGGRSLMRQCADRLRGLAGADGIFVVTAESLAAATRKELPELAAANVVGEPMRRDTGAAVALGVGLAASSGDDVIGFFPADQLVGDVPAFRRAVAAAVREARSSGRIVTIGIRPDYPSTAYGYVDPKRGGFVEKPDSKRAAAYLRRGYLWNAGIFIAKASVFREALAAHAPALLPLAGMHSPRSRTRKRLAAFYEALPRISFDYAVMEKVGRVSVVPGDFGWDDVGGYAAFSRHFESDGAGNISVGDVRTLDASESLAVAKGARITLFGVKGLVVVSSGDDVLVMSKDKAAEMKRLFAR